MEHEADAEISEEPNVSLDRSIEGMKCFVIMPYGDKPDPESGRILHFDEIFDQLIEPTVTGLKLQCVRSDKVSQSGLIHKEMISHIIDSDVVIVDITTANPNVLYELGVRHTARKSGTIIICQETSRIPFNISGMRAMMYRLPVDKEDPGQLSHGIEYYRSLLETNIRNSLVSREVDSLVHTLRPGLNVSLPPKPIPECKTLVYEIENNRQLEIITGDIAKVKNVDVWVNAENTRMEMGRLHDSSVSALIRYHGAKKDSRGFVKRDTINDLLQKQLGKRGWAGVEPGTVVLTRSGELEHNNNVKRIVHTAAQHGEPTRGYTPIRGYVRCLTNALNCIDEYNRSSTSSRSGELTSILITLFGTRSSGPGAAQDITYDLVQGAKEYLRLNSHSKIKRVAFLAYTDFDLELCKIAFQRNRLKETTEQ